MPKNRGRASRGSAQTVEGYEGITITQRHVGGDAGHVDPADIDIGAGAWAYDRVCDRAWVGGGAADRARVVVSGAAPAGGSGMDRVVVGDVGEQPAGAVLQADGGGAEATGGAIDAVGTGGTRDWTHHEAGGGVSDGRAQILPACAVGRGAGGGDRELHPDRDG